MRLKLDTFIGIVLIGVVIVFGCAWLTSWVTASTDNRGHDRDRDRDKPKDMNFAFQVRQDQGIRTMSDLIAEEEQEIGRKLRIRTDPICRLSLLVAGPKGGADLILPTSPDTSHDFIIPQGKLTEFQLSKETAIPVTFLSFRSDGITNASIYWAYCD